MRNQVSTSRCQSTAHPLQRTNHPIQSHVLRGAHCLTCGLTIDRRALTFVPSELKVVGTFVGRVHDMRNAQASWCGLETPPGPCVGVAAQEHRVCDRGRKKVQRVQLAFHAHCTTITHGTRGRSHQERERRREGTESAQPRVTTQGRPHSTTRTYPSARHRIRRMRSLGATRASLRLLVTSDNQSSRSPVPDFPAP